MSNGTASNSSANKKNIVSPEQITHGNPGGGITREMCELARWGLPPGVLSRYHQAGITHMFTWQAECLSLNGVLSGKNLVYCAPTSAGKTLVAELLLLKRVLETKQKVLFILPFVSVAGEKTSYLEGILQGTGLKVGGFFGSKGPPGGISKVDVAVCTIEKGNSIVNRMMEKGELGEIGCVVVDEVHMVGDSSRGYLLELLLTKLLYHSRQENSSSSSLQIVGMSATLPNLDLLSRWLDAALYTTDFRPVPLTQLVKIGNIVHDLTGKPVRQLPSLPHEHITFLCQEVLQSGHNVLIFCSTKAWTEKLCDLIAGTLLNKTPALDQTLVLNAEGLKEISQQLSRLPMTVDPVLARCVRRGIAYHHAGLTIQEREVVEAGFRRGVIRVLIATSTLSAGVNLPARRVIIRSPKFGPSYMSPLVYQQMSGRAGRMGVDEAGDCVLICTPQERGAIDKIVSNIIDPVSSCLGGNRLGAAMKRAMLEIIAGGIVSKTHEVTEYFQSTLLAAEQKHCPEILTSALEFLVEYEFISKLENSEGEMVYTATKLGFGTLNSALPPEEALDLLSHLVKARRNFNLESELQLVFEVTPLSVSRNWATPDWLSFHTMWSNLSPAYKRAGNNVGVDEGYLVGAASGHAPTRTEHQKLKFQIHLRFIAALALLESIEEVPIDRIANKYSTNRGLLQSLQTAASSYAGQVAVFCERLGFRTLGLLLSDLQVRLFSGVQKELCDLVRVQLLTGPLARVLYNEGYTGVAKLSLADPETIKTLLQGVLPFKDKEETRERSWLDKRHGLTELEAATLMIESAKELLQEDLVQMDFKVDLSDILKTKDKKNKSHRTSNALYRGGESSRSRVGETVRSSDVKDLTSSVLEIPDILTPHRPTQSVILRASSRRKSSFGGALGEGQKQSSRVETVRINDLDISSSFDEFNLSAWDFLEVDKDLLASVEKDAKKESPKRKSMSPRKSSSKKQKIGSPAKSPLKFKTIPDKPVESRVRQALSFTEDDKHSISSLDTVEPVPMRGPGEVVSLADDDMTLPPLLPSPHHSPATTQPNSPLISVSYSAGEVPNTTPLKRIATKLNCVESPSKSSYSIVDVSGDRGLFDVFVEELRSKTQYSISVAWDHVMAQEQFSANNTLSFAESIGEQLNSVESAQVVGIAFCWGGMESYYVSLKEDVEEPELSGCTPMIHPELSLEMRVQTLSDILQQVSLDTSSLLDMSLNESSACESRYQRIGFDIRTQWKLLATSLDISIEEDVRDCKVAAWLLDPTLSNPNSVSLVTEYIPEVARKCGMRDSSVPVFSTPRVRAALDALLAWHLHCKLEVELKNKNLLVSYKEVECPCIRVLARMELNGFGFSVEEYGNQRQLMQAHMERLEKLAYKLAHTTFSLSSPGELSEVLFSKLHLPPHDPNKPAPRCTERRRKFFSTNKEVLTRLSPLHPLPAVVLLWRKISSALSRTMLPLQSAIVKCKGLNMNRVHSISETYSSTGRVSFREPNVQNINKEFALDFPEQIKVTDSSFTAGSACLRSMFEACEGCVLVAADYSQLELRILGHMSGDKKLRDQLNSGGDVFKAVAAGWKQCSVSDVTSEQRAHAKQICYGILYGMGSVSLAKELGCSEKEAAEFVVAFKNRYLGLRNYITKTVNMCQEKGYVETILHRVRFLPNIHSDQPGVQAQAQRQAVNTTIQGSAADIVKVAMVNIDRQLLDKYPDTAITHSQRPDALLTSQYRTQAAPRGAYLVLQLHDELIYEVRNNMGSGNQFISNFSRELFELSSSFSFLIVFFVDCSMQIVKTVFQILISTKISWFW